MKTSHRILMYALISLLLVGIAQAALSDGLIAYYELDSDGTDSTGNFSLDNQGSVTFSGGGAVFDGSTTQYLNNTALAQYFNGKQAFTFLFVLASDVTNTDKGFFTSDTPTGADTTSLQCRFDADSSGTIRCGADMTAGSTIDIESASGIQTTAEQMITFTWDASTDSGEVKLYINDTKNTLSVSGTDTNALDVGASDYFQVGRGAKETTGSFDGTIYRLLVYDRSLNSTEITEFYNSGSYRDYAYITGGSPANTTNTSNIILNLTFDTDFTDYSPLNHTFTATGSVSQTNSSICKWYGCLNLSATSGDYINSTSLASNINKLGLEYWIYYDNQPGSSNTQAAWRIGSGATEKDTQYSTYCFNPNWEASNGTVSTNTYSSGCVNSDNWYYVVEQYNGTHYELWLNGDQYYKSSAEDFGDLQYSLGEPITIGTAGGSDIEGYIDEFVAYNDSVFNDSIVLEKYNAKVLGTPPTIDLTVKQWINATTAYKYDYSTEYNDLNTTGFIPLAVNITNHGTENTTNFNTVVYIEGTIICDWELNLTAGETVSRQCDISKEAKIYTGNITVDVGSVITEDTETNNAEPIYIAFLPHPYILPNITTFQNEIEPYCSNSSNAICYTIYNWASGYVSENFNSGWGVSDVDPRGVKGMENAVNCFINDYANSTACTYAWNHLDGWTALENWQDGSVQAIHELERVMKIFDLMAPNMTQEQLENYSKEFSRIAVEVFSKSNVQPQQDSDDISPANGYGFGFGMAYPAVAILGDYVNNPSSVYYPENERGGYSMPYYWDLRLRKNLAQEGCSEGVLYCNYMRYHVMDYLVFDARHNITGISTDYNEEICSIGEFYINRFYDAKYDGSSLRGDDTNYMRWYSFGDTHSYDLLGEDDNMGAALLTTIASVCQNETISRGVATLRRYLYDKNNGETGYSRPDMDLFYLYDIKDITNLTEQEYVNAFGSNYNDFWDIAEYRPSYNYVNDTVIFCDSGVDPGYGHPNAEFDCSVYALGEPFIDQIQVPYNDDVRTENWKNTFICEDSPSTTGYIENANTPPLSQSYGGIGSMTLTEYLTGTGDLLPAGISKGQNNTYINAKDEIMTTRMWANYSCTVESPEVYVVVLDNVMLQFWSANRSNAGFMGNNWINIYEEFTPTISGTDLLLNRDGTSKYYNISVLYNSTTLGLTGGNSTVQASKSKTSLGLSVYYGRYVHFANTTQDYRVLYAHKWYEGTDNTPISSTSSNGDQGAVIGNKSVYFDTNKDGKINASLFDTDAWALTINANGTGTYLASGATYVNYNGISLYSGSQDSFIASYVAVNETLNPYPAVVAYLPVNGSNAEYGSTVEIVANITTQNSTLNLTLVTVAYPNGTTTNYTLSNAVDDKYNYSLVASVLGQHNLTFYASNNYSNANNTETLTYFVVDTTAPTWTVEPSNDSFYNNTNYTAQYNASDNVAIDTFFLNDTTYMNITSTGLLTVTTKVPGNYTVNVSVNDTSNNILSKVISITVIAYTDGLALVDFDSYELYTENNLTGMSYKIEDSRWYDADEEYYVLIEADALTTSGFTGQGHIVTQINSTMWKITTTGTYEVQRAKIIKTLFFGTTGSDPRATSTYITNFTRILSNDPRDTDKKAYYMYAYDDEGGVSSTNQYYYANFSNTVNNNVSVWTKVRAYQDTVGCDTDNVNSFARIDSTTINTATKTCGTTGWSESDQTAIASSDAENPTQFYFWLDDNSDRNIRGEFFAFFLTKDNVTFTNSNMDTVSYVSFFDVHSVPEIELSYYVINDTISLPASDYVVIGSKNTYFNVTENFTVMYDVDMTVNLTGFYNAIVNITLTEAFSGSSATNFTFLFNSTIYNANLTANLTYYEVPFLLYYNVTVVLDDIDYISVNTTVNITSTPYLIALTAFRSIELNVNFFDEETLLDVNNVSFEVLNEYFSNSFNTGAASNSYYLAPLTDGLYEIRYSAPDYPKRSYHFVIPLNDEDQVNISLYLVADVDSQLFLRTITDQGNNPLSTYYLEVQRPYASTDNTSLIYRSVEIASIDNQGDAVFTAIPNTQQYRFRLLDEDLQLVNTLSPSYLVDTSSTIIATQTETVMGDFNSATDATTSLTYQNSTSSFIFDYTAPATVDQVCLVVTNNTGWTSSKQTVCSSSYTGTLTITVDDDQNVTYEAVGYVYPSSGVSIPVDTETKDFQFRGSRQVVRYIGAFLYVLTLILCATIGAFKNPVPAIALALIATVAFSVSFLGLFTFSTLLTGGLLVISVVVLLLTKESDS